MYQIPPDHPVNQFVNFAELVWKHKALPPLTVRQKEICWWLQRGPKRSQTWAFRGVGKSYICSAYVCWLLLLNPDEKILVISASKERADQFVKFTRGLIDEMPVLRHLHPNRKRGDRDSMINFDVGSCVPAHSPSVRSVGITGSITGSRASTIVLDDVEVPTNSATPAMREKLAEAVKECDSVLLPENEALGVDPKIRVLGTPQSMDTIYQLMSERGYTPRIWPVQVPDPHLFEGYRGCLAPSIQSMIDSGEKAGTPTEPSRFHTQDIDERRISLGTLTFALQFMLSTSLSDAEKYPLKTKDLIVSNFPVNKGREIYVHSNIKQYRLQEHENVGMQGDGFFRAADEIGEWTPFESTILAIDPSARGKDETAFISMSQLGGHIFVHRVAGLLDGYTDKTLNAIAEEAKRVKANKIVIEANYGDGMFSALLRPFLNRVYPCAIEEVKHSTVKERRIIDTLAPVMEGHRLVFDEAVLNSDRVPHEGDAPERARERQLFYQMTHLTDERGCLAHDDRLDCLAIGVAHFTQFMNLDPRVEARMRDEEAWDRMAGIATDSFDSSWLHYGAVGKSTLSDPFAL